MWEKNMNTQIKAGFFLSQKVDKVDFIDYSDKCFAFSWSINSKTLSMHTFLLISLNYVILKRIFFIKF